MLKDLIYEPESKTLEFKQDLSSPRPLLKTLVAFANSAGGRLVLGVTDDRRVIGMEQPLDEEERLANLIADSITPRLVPNVELVTVEGKTLLVVEVFLSGMPTTRTGARLSASPFSTIASKSKARACSCPA